MDELLSAASSRINSGIHGCKISRPTDDAMKKLADGDAGTRIIDDGKLFIGALEAGRDGETAAESPGVADGPLRLPKALRHGAWLGARCAAVPAGIAGYIGLLRAKTARRMYGTRRSRLRQGTGRRLMYGRARMPRTLLRAESFLAPRTVTVPRIRPPRSLILAFCMWTRTRHLKLPSNMGATRCWRRLRTLRSYTCSTGTRPPMRSSGT